MPNPANAGLSIRLLGAAHAPLLLAFALTASLPCMAGDGPDRGAPTELFLAGGALDLCSSLAPRHCRDDVKLAPGRGAARYRLDAETIDAASDPRLWAQADDARPALIRTLLQAAQAHAGERELDEDALHAALDTACRKSEVAAACAPKPLWARLDDHERGSLLAALEQPQLDQDVDGRGGRKREQVALDGSRDAAGAEILRAFVAAAARAAGAPPKVAIVTASAFDSMDAVDYYIAALRQAGADPRWWPIDAAAARVVFGGGDCAALDAARIAELAVARRAQIYPDHAATQQAWCERADAQALPTDLHGVFFAGGDQWRLRQALVQTDGTPNRWLRELRAAFAAGRVVVGGTSAGAAVQSPRAMIGNGSAEHALRHGGEGEAPPVPGCSRSGRCTSADEDRLSWWPAGGIGLAPLVVDTHFSERSREWRLLRLLHGSGERAALGVDETSALQLSGHPDGDIEVRALGRSGGWLFTIDARDCAGLSGRAHYLAAGNRLNWRAGEVLLETADTVPHAPASGTVRQLSLADGLRPAALRTSMQALVPLDAGPIEFGDGSTSLRLTRTSQTRAVAGTAALRSVLGVDFELRLDVPACGAER
jgi:cyanophycinase-like exopeptidase